MATKERVKRDVAELAARSRSVRFAEIQRLMNQVNLLDGYSVRSREVNHGTMFYVSDGRRTETVQVNDNTGRSPHVLRVYVDAVIEALELLGLGSDADDQEGND